MIGAKSFRHGKTFRAERPRHGYGTATARPRHGHGTATARPQDEKTSDVIRPALRLLDREAGEERARGDMHRLSAEDLSAKPDAWEFDADGNIRIVGSDLTVPASTSAQASVLRLEAGIAGRGTKILIDQVRAIDVAHVAGELVDYLSWDDMTQVEHSLSRYFGLLR